MNATNVMAIETVHRQELAHRYRSGTPGSCIQCYVVAIHNELLEMMDELLETCNVAILAKRSSKHTWEQPHAWDDRGFWGCPDSF